jgi:hypothetical protein
MKTPCISITKLMNHTKDEIKSHYYQFGANLKTVNDTFHPKFKHSILCDTYDFHLLI